MNVAVKKVLPCNFDFLERWLIITVLLYFLQNSEAINRQDRWHGRGHHAVKERQEHQPGAQVGSMCRPNV